MLLYKIQIPKVYELAISVFSSLQWISINLSN